MYKIVRKRNLNPTVTQMEIEAPLVAKKAKPGQFIILRVDSEGERIPLTVAGCNPEEGTVKIIFQIVGATTEELNHKAEGEFIEDFVGPLGTETHHRGPEKGLHHRRRRRMCHRNADRRGIPQTRRRGDEHHRIPQQGYRDFGRRI